MTKSKRKKVSNDHLLHPTGAMNFNSSNVISSNGTEPPYDCHVVMKTDGQSKTMREWTIICTDHFYPHAGTRTCRVPPSYYNHQNLLTAEQAAKKNLVVQPSTSTSSSSSSPSSLALASPSPSPSPSLPTSSSSTSQSSPPLSFQVVASTPLYPPLSSSSSSLPSSVVKGVSPKEIPENGHSSSKNNNTSGVSVDKVHGDLSACPHCRKQHPQHRNPKNLQQQPPVQILFPTQESIQRRDKAMSIVLDSFETLGLLLEAEGEKGICMMSGVNFDHYLCRIPGQLRRTWNNSGYLGESLSSRGILDILAVQEKSGVVLIQVKAVGGNTEEWSASEQDMIQVLVGVVQKVQSRSKTLKNDLYRELLHNTRSDEHDDSDIPIVHVLALPLLSRQLYQTMLDIEKRKGGKLPDLHVLCQEDFEDFACQRLHHSHYHHLHQRQQHHHHHYHNDHHHHHQQEKEASMANPLYRWWMKNFGRRDVSLSTERIKVIVGRICGIFSTVTPLPDTKCRTEVRTLGHCVSETASRYSAPVLTVQEYEVSGYTDKQLVLCGLPGTGSSILLILKAAQWLRENCEHLDTEPKDEQNHVTEHHVIVASIRTSKTAHSAPSHSSARRPQDIALAMNIRNRSLEGRQGCGHVRHLHEVVLDMDGVELDHVQEAVRGKLNALAREIKENSMVETFTPRRRESDRTFHQEELHEEKAPSTNRAHQQYVRTSTKPVKVLNCTSNFKDVMDIEASVNLQEDESLPLKAKQCTCIHIENDTYPKVTFSFVMADVEQPEDAKTSSALLAVAQFPLTERLWLSTAKHKTKLNTLSKDFRLVELAQVIRRPPHVQRVLKRLERTEEWKNSYNLDSLESGLLTNGLPVVCVKHFDHNHILRSKIQPTLPQEKRHDVRTKKYCQTSSDEEKDLHIAQIRSNATQRTCSSTQRQDMEIDEADSLTTKPKSFSLEEEPNKLVEASLNGESNGNHKSVDHTCKSPFWCKECADSLSSLVEYFITDSATPKVAPFIVGSTKLLKDPSKNRFGVAIKPKDILILTSVAEPSDCSEHPHGERDHKGHTAAERSRRSWWKSILQSPLVEQLRKKIPLRVLNGESAGKIVFPRNYAVLTDAGNARGLEKKLVIFVPWQSSGVGNTAESSIHKREVHLHSDLTSAIRQRGICITSGEGNDDASAMTQNDNKLPVPFNDETRAPTVPPFLKFIEDPKDLVSGESMEHDAVLAESVTTRILSSQSGSMYPSVEGLLQTPEFDLSDRELKSSDGNSDSSSWDSDMLEVCDMSTDSEDSEESSVKDFELSEPPGQRGEFFLQTEGDRVEGRQTPTQPAVQVNNISAARPKTSKTSLTETLRKRTMSRPTDLKDVDYIVVKMVSPKIAKENFENDVERKGGHSAPTISSAAADIVDDALETTSDDLSLLTEADRDGLYIAASCCLAQLVVILP